MLFKKLSPEKLRSVSIPVRLTGKESEVIRNAAGLRGLSVAEFVRRAALGRKSDVQIEDQIISEMRELREKLDKMHANIVETGCPPTEIALTLLLDEVVRAMANVSR